MMPSAKMPIRPSAPPVNIDSMPPMPWLAPSMKSRSAAPSIPGTGMKVPSR